MAVYHLFRNAPFIQEQFEQVSRERGLGEQTDALRNLVAYAVLECAQKGIFDPFEMRRCAHEVLSAPKSER